MKREIGYYWVRISDTWKISYYKFGIFVIGVICLGEEELSEINEQRIKAPNEQ